VEKCDDIEFEIGWERLERPEVLELIRERCRKIAADQGKAFMKSLYDNLPTMIFLFLPLIALVQKFLYLGSGRYYVEHLLFFVHFHSFFFLTLTMTILLARIPDLFPGQGVVTVLSIIALSIYIPVYLFKALRRVYGQGFLFTLIKYLLLITAYFFCLAITMMLGLLYTVLTV
ncbi:MAG: hypothetical protein HKN06_05015, partial [Gammaproteobacteria bacterium]|nr:hypothetical protein [Gammaproteobacteria bacterium]